MRRILKRYRLLHKPGSLVGMDEYLYRRTGGMIGSLSQLIRSGAILAIENRSEAAPATCSTSSRSTTRPNAPTSLARARVASSGRRADAPGAATDPGRSSPTRVSRLVPEQARQPPRHAHQ
jgi:hypothetical protein